LVRRRRPDHGLGPHGHLQLLGLLRLRLLHPAAARAHLLHQALRRRRRQRRRAGRRVRRHGRGQARQQVRRRHRRPPGHGGAQPRARQHRHRRRQRAVRPVRGPVQEAGLPARGHERRARHDLRQHVRQPDRRVHAARAVDPAARAALHGAGALRAAARRGGLDAAGVGARQRDLLGLLPRAHQPDVARAVVGRRAADHLPRRHRRPAAAAAAQQPAVRRRHRRRPAHHRRLPVPQLGHLPRDGRRAPPQGRRRRRRRQRRRGPV
ncbi:hypothetical protein LTR60_007035, partial [Cryomyces antarcticus]